MRAPSASISSRSLRVPNRRSAGSWISENSATISRNRKRRKRTPAGKVKEVKFRVNIDEHDYLTKIRHAEEFLDKGNKVKIHLAVPGA